MHAVIYNILRHETEMGNKCLKTRKQSASLPKSVKYHFFWLPIYIAVNSIKQLGLLISFSKQKHAKIQYHQISFLKLYHASKPNPNPKRIKLLGSFIPSIKLSEDIV